MPINQTMTCTVVVMTNGCEENGDTDEREHVATDNEDDKVQKGDKGFKMKLRRRSKIKVRQYP